MKNNYHNTLILIVVLAALIAAILALRFLLQR